MKLERPVPVGRVIGSHGSTPMHWLVRSPDEAFTARCAQSVPGTSRPAIRHYDGFIEAITCRQCLLLRRADLRAQAIAYVLEAISPRREAEELLTMLGVRTAELPLETDVLQ